MKNKLSLTKEELQSLSESGYAWDFKANPHHFPIYLFLYFREKYSLKSKLSVWYEQFFSLNVAICKCDSFALPEGYEAALIVSKLWETSTKFIFIMGKTPFKPNIAYMSSTGYPNISLAAMTYDGRELEVQNSAHLLGDGTEGFKILNVLSAISAEINSERKKADFFHNVEAEV